ncbi:MAG: NAD(P)H-dependent oxidoreductase [Planctomycetota bacterium]|nr:NAD(P)H-dependent oxidoreductase [Planctomycetota bacterium]
MRILTIYSHPIPDSFNAAILTAISEEVALRGHEHNIRDLYKMGFNPVLGIADFEQFNRGTIPADIKKEQDAIRKADILFLVHPIWWSGMPAILKGWIERVFSYGFAYGHDSKGVKALLTGKKAVIVNTTGGTEKSFADSGFGDAFRLLAQDSIYRFVGLDIALHRTFYQIPSVSREARGEMLDSLRADLQRIL